MFLTDLVVRAGESDDWVLAQALKYKTAAGELITVPVGFVTDLASVPVGFRNLFPINDRSRKAAVVHDYLYSLKNGGDKGREKADQIFLHAMKLCGVAWWKRSLMYRAVRMFGWWFW
jgi:hypothetical protein